MEHRFKNTGPWLFLCWGLFGVLVGVSVYTFYYAKGASYLSKDPKACVNCHVMRDHYSSWQKSSHHAVSNCIDCHLPREVISKYVAKLQNGYRHSVKFTLQNYPDPIRIHEDNKEILNQNCIECHKAFISAITAHHPAGSESVSCITCHQNVGHGPRK